MGILHTQDSGRIHVKIFFGHFYRSLYVRKLETVQVTALISNYKKCS